MSTPTKIVIGTLAVSVLLVVAIVANLYLVGQAA